MLSTLWFGLLITSLLPILEQCCQKDCHARVWPYEEINGNHRRVQIRNQHFTCEGELAISLAIP
jgi:hypothetical protein